MQITINSADVYNVTSRETKNGRTVHIATLKFNDGNYESYLDVESLDKPFAFKKGAALKDIKLFLNGRKWTNPEDPEAVEKIFVSFKLGHYEANGSSTSNRNISKAVEDAINQMASASPNCIKAVHLYADAHRDITDAREFVRSFKEFRAKIGYSDDFRSITKDDWSHISDAITQDRAEPTTEDPDELPF